LRNVDSPSPILFDDYYLSYWEYVPVTSVTDPVAFEYDGLAWTYSQEVVPTTEQPPPCDPEPGHVCSD
jgi:hypothetical protein